MSSVVVNQSPGFGGDADAEGRDRAAEQLDQEAEAHSRDALQLDMTTADRDEDERGRHPQDRADSALMRSFSARDREMAESDRLAARDDRINDTDRDFAKADARELDANARDFAAQDRDVERNDADVRSVEIDETYAEFAELERDRHSQDRQLAADRRRSSAGDRDRARIDRLEKGFRQAQVALQASESRYRLIADSVGDMVMRVADGNWAWLSPSVNAVLGWPPDSLTGEPTDDLIYPDDQAATRKAALDTARGEDSRLRVRLRSQRGWLWTECNITPYLDDSGNAAGLVIIARDISAQVMAEKAAEAALADLAYRSSHDLLTGLRNRYEILEFLRKALDGRREGELVAVLFIDVDRFKEINDGISHAAGDVVLTGIADRLRAWMRPTDLIGRLGGDEFAAILPGLGHVTDAIRTAERLCGEVARDRFEAEGTQVRVTVSVGIATSRSNSTPAEMLSEADAAVYEAKGSGRNRWEVAGEVMRAEAARRLDVTNRIRVGLDAAEFHAWLQPIVDLRDRAVIGYEALARWTTERGTEDAFEFIGVAEDTGLILELGSVAISEAIACLPWLEPQQFLTVNASPAQLSAPSFAANLQQTMRDAGADATRLVVEITEHGLLNLGPSSRAGLHSLSQAGVGIYVDDFGTGFSSLSTLRDYPVTGIKLDMSFTHRLTEKPDDPSWNVVSGLSELAAHLGLRRIAEGIETAEQESALKGMGWSDGQGWLYGRAVAPATCLPRLPAQRTANTLIDGAAPDKDGASHRRRRRDSVQASVPNPSTGD